MPTFGPISDPTPNVLFDPGRALLTAGAIQRNQLMMENQKQDQAAQMHERDANARIALARQFADAPDEALASEWGPAVQRMQQAGLGMGIDPSRPPPRDRLKQIAASDLTTFQRMKLEVEREQAAAMGQYRTGMLDLAQQREQRVASAPRGGGGGGRGGGDGIELVPLAAPASAPAAPSAGGGNTAGPAPSPAGPQVSEAAPEISPTAARLGGVDVAGPGAPPAPAPAAPAAGVRMMVRNGMPITTGLPTGQAWGVDASGARMPVDIPGVRKMGGDAPAPLIGGQGLDSALMNILVGGDPSSPQYAAAFARLGAEEVLANGTTRRPDMSPFRVPTYRPPGVMEPGAPGAGAAAPGAEPALPQGGRTFGKAETTQAPKEVPAKVADGMLENVGAVRKIDDALLELTARNGEGVGLIAGNLPTAISSRTDPKGVKLRALIADIGSLKLHDRSGANVTASESPRLLPFIPMTSDDADTVRTKLQNFRREYLTALRDQQETYGPATGHKPMAPVERLLQGAGGSRPPLSSFGR